MNRPFTLSSHRKGISLTKSAVSTHPPKATQKFKGVLVILILLTYLCRVFYLLDIISEMKLKA